MKTLEKKILTEIEKNQHTQRLLFVTIKMFFFFSKKVQYEFINFKMVEMRISSCGPVLELIVNKEMCRVLCDANYGYTNISQSAGAGGVREHLGFHHSNPRI